MRVQKAIKSDYPRIIALARDLGLDYSGMEADDFWVASEGREVFGICGLKEHPDCRELLSLGVHSDRRGLGLGLRLVRALLAETSGDVYLTTVIPAFFEKSGFERTLRIPPSMIKKGEWCDGCDKTLCTVMVRRAE